MSHLTATAGAEDLLKLADTMAGSDRAAAKAAGEALRRAVHHAGRPGAAAEAKAAAAQLVRLIGSDRPRAVRAEALRLLGFIGGNEAVGAIARQLSDADIREDARMALERIPGRAAENALKAALKAVPEDYRPAIQQSLRHRSRKGSAAGVKP